MLRHAHASPKLANLKRFLGVPRYQAVGLLECLWHFTATQAPRGDIGKWSDDEIAAALEWQGDAGDLLRALERARWIDACPVHRYVVHDWEQHSDQTVKRSPAVREAGFAQRQTSDSLASNSSAASEPLERGSSGASGSPDSLTPEPEPEPEPEPDIAPRRRLARRVLSDCPEALSPEQQDALRAWCASKHPSLVRDLPEIWDELVTWAKANGYRKADWYAQMQTFVRRRAQSPPMRANGFHPQPQPPPRSRITAEHWKAREIPVD